MYYPHFGLKEPPFKITPNTDFFFSGGNRGAILDALVYAITNGEGIIKVVGEVGSGKTMLCRMLQTILPEHVESIYLANPSMAPQDVLHAIAFELQIKLPKNADRLKVMQLLQAYLLERHAQGRQVVIFVEEAQGMPIATLEEIRLLSNLETKQDKLLQIVLFGQPELDVNLNETHIRQLRERITHSFQLGPLHTKDIGDYLIFRLRAAGYHGPHLFTAAAIKKLSNAAQGLVRRVNILADKALLAAFAENQYQVTPKHVKAAIKDSEFGQKAKLPLVYIGVVMGVSLLLTLAFILVQAKLSANTKKVSNPIVLSNPQAPANSTVQPYSIVKSNLPVQSIQPSVLDVNASTSQPNAALIQSVVEKPSQAKADAILITKKADLVPLQSSNPEVVNFLDTRLAASEIWLKTAAPNTATLQIMTITDDAQLNTQLDFLKKQLDHDKLYLYRKNRAENPYTVVLYGAYAQREEALNVLDALPENIQENNPQVRTIAGINRDIQQTQ